ncbi:histone methyltransferase [Chloropicon primus]|uniref:Histone methyltransferase n=3 Tax=Chloropicon primus TaxID=1764295 RepID=A0A5B8MPL1_9CHLO|nr:histone methyltransferase [Chloropicon primus]|eukprot:QDZ21535.1 histone methyltransferase [Chloropicon primus]
MIAKQQQTNTNTNTKKKKNNNNNNNDNNNNGCFVVGEREREGGRGEKEEENEAEVPSNGREDERREDTNQNASTSGSEGGVAKHSRVRVVEVPSAVPSTTEDGGRGNGEIVQLLDEVVGEVAEAAVPAPLEHAAAGGSAGSSDLVPVETRVEILWDNPKQYFGGVVTAFDWETGIYSIRYDDGEVGEEDLHADATTFRVVEEADLVGRRVEVHFEAGGSLPGGWYPGTIEAKVEARGRQLYHVRYDDGDEDDLDPRSRETMYRLLPEGSDDTETGPLKTGKKRGRKSKVESGDQKRNRTGGKRKTKATDQDAQGAAEPGSLPVGTRLEVLFDNPPQYYPGTVVMVTKKKKGKGELHHIRYDDGDEEPVDLHDGGTVYRLVEVKGAPKKRKVAAASAVKQAKEEGGKDKEKKRMKKKSRTFHPVRTRVEIWFDDLKKFCSATVIAHKQEGKSKKFKHCVQYEEDLLIEYVDLDAGDTKYRVVDPESMPKKKVKSPRKEVAKAQRKMQQLVRARPEDIVWARMKGYPWWPCEKLVDPDEAMNGGQSSKNKRVSILFFGKDVRDRGVVDSSQVVPFLDHFEEHASLDKSTTTTKALKKKQRNPKLVTQREMAIQQACSALGYVYKDGKLKKGKAGDASAQAKVGKTVKRKKPEETAEEKAAKAKAKEEELSAAMKKRIAAGLRVPKPKVIEDFGYPTNGSKPKKAKREEPPVQVAKVEEKLPVVPLEHFEVNDIVWAKSRGCPFWPAQIVDLNQLPDAVKRLRKVKTLSVIYLGPSSKEQRGADYGWIGKGDILPFKEYVENFRTQRITKSHKSCNYFKAIDIAERIQRGEDCQGVEEVDVPPPDQAEPGAEKVVVDDGTPRCKSCNCVLKGGVSHEARRWTNLCRSCKNCYENGDFCKVCEDLYLPTEKDMACCDSCNSWIHGRCDPEAANVIAMQAKNPNSEVPYKCVICREIFTKHRKASKFSKGVTFLNQGTKLQMEAKRLFAVDYLVQARKKKGFSIRSVNEEEEAVKNAWTELGAHLQGEYLAKASAGSEKKKKKPAAEKLAPSKTQSGIDSSAPRRAKGPWNAVNLKSFTPVRARWAKDHCSVCNLDYDYDFNQFITCTACGVTVHQFCYGVMKRPALDDVWLCRACENQKKGEKAPQCCVCPVEGGALKPTTIKGHWCHVACCQWIPELTVLDQERVEPIARVQHIHKDRWTKKCSICKVEQGVIIQCDSCYVAFHPLCARMKGFEMETIETENGTIECRAYCARHSKEIKPGKGLLPATSEVEIEGKKCLTDPSQYVFHIDLPPLDIKCPSGCSRLEPLDRSLGWEREAKGSGRGISSTKGFWIPEPLPVVEVALPPKETKAKLPKSNGRARKSWVTKPVELLPLPEGCPEEIKVCCGKAFGVMNVRTQNVLYDGKTLPPSIFEKVGGKSHAKKWKTSLWACNEAGDPALPMSDWLGQFKLEKEQLFRLLMNTRRREQYEQWRARMEHHEVENAVTEIVEEIVQQVSAHDDVAQSVKDPSVVEPTECGPDEGGATQGTETDLSEKSPEPSQEDGDERAIQEVLAGILQQVVGQDTGIASGDIEKKPPGESEAALVDDKQTLRRQLGMAVVGQKFSIFWSEEDKWHSAKVVAYSREHDVHRIEYQTGYLEWLKLTDQKIRWEMNLSESSSSGPATLPGMDEEAPPRKDLGHCVGKRVGIWWEDDKQFYYGQVGAYNPFDGKVHVWYDDGMKEWLDFGKEKFEWSEERIKQPTIVPVECNGLTGHLCTSSKEVSFLGLYLTPEMFVELAGHGWEPSEWKKSIHMSKEVDQTQQTVGIWLLENGFESSRFSRSRKNIPIDVRPTMNNQRAERRPRTGKQAFVRGLAYRVKFPSKEKKIPSFKAWTAEQWLQKHPVAVQGPEDDANAMNKESGGDQKDNVAAEDAEVDAAVKSFVDAVVEAVAKGVEEEEEAKKAAQRPVEPTTAEEVVPWVVNRLIQMMEFKAFLGMFPGKGVVGAELKLSHSLPGSKTLTCTVEGFDLDKSVLHVAVLKPPPAYLKVSALPTAAPVTLMRSIKFGDEVIKWKDLFQPQLTAKRKRRPPFELLFRQEGSLFHPLCLGLFCVGWRVSVEWEDDSFYYGVVDDFNFLDGRLRIIYDDGSFEWFEPRMVVEKVQWLAKEGDYRKPRIGKIPDAIYIVCNGMRGIFHVHTRRVEVPRKAAGTPASAMPKLQGGEGSPKPANDPVSLSDSVTLMPEDELHTVIRTKVTELIEFVAEYHDDTVNLLSCDSPSEEEVASLVSKFREEELSKNPELGSPARPVAAADGAPKEEVREPVAEDAAAEDLGVELVTLEEFENRARLLHPKKRKVRAKVLKEDKYTVMQWLLKEGLEINKLSLAYRKRNPGQVEEAKLKRKRKKQKAKSESEDPTIVFDVVPLLEQIQKCSAAEKAKVTFGKSVIHGWGLFAKVAIKEGETVVEYRGDIVRPSVANQRELRYKLENKDLYLFTANERQVIDSTDVGSIGRFMNHSCAPSCYIKSAYDSKAGLPHLAFFARCDILPGQELTFDYRLQEEDAANKIECKCGAPTCKGTLN